MTQPLSAARWPAPADLAAAERLAERFALQGPEAARFAAAVWRRVSGQPSD